MLNADPDNASAYIELAKLELKVSKATAYKDNTEASRLKKEAIRDLALAKSIYEKTTPCATSKSGFWDIMEIAPISKWSRQKFPALASTCSARLKRAGISTVGRIWLFPRCLLGRGF